MEAVHAAAEKLREFVFSPSGQVSLTTSLSKGVLVTFLGVGAAVLGAPTQASADWCYGIPENQYGWICTGNPCSVQGQCVSPPSACYWENQYFHDQYTGCTYIQRRCGVC